MTLLSLTLQVLISLAFAYLLGSINSAIIICKIFKLTDVRSVGSHNAGLTNMLRTQCKKYALLCAFGDSLKVALAFVLPIYWEISLQYNFNFLYLVGLVAVIGHIFPIYYNFKAGKGVMPSVAVILLLDWQIFLLLAGLALIMFMCWKKMSAVSLASALLFPSLATTKALLQNNFQLANLFIWLTYTILIIFSHRSNIKRLVSGTEVNLYEDKKP